MPDSDLLIRRQTAADEEGVRAVIAGRHSGCEVATASTLS